MTDSREVIPTPRTDAFSNIPSEDQSASGIAADWADFARQLERENAELRARAELADANYRTAYADAVATDAKFQGAVSACAHFAQRAEKAERVIAISRHALERLVQAARDPMNPCALESACIEGEAAIDAAINGTATD